MPKARNIDARRMAERRRIESDALDLIAKDLETLFASYRDNKDGNGPTTLRYAVFAKNVQAALWNAERKVRL